MVLHVDPLKAAVRNRTVLVLTKVLALCKTVIKLLVEG